HLVVVDLVTGPVDECVGIGAVAGGELAVHARDTIRRADQPGTLRILANLSKQGSDGALDLLAIALRVHPRDASSQPSGGGRAAQARRPHRSLPPERTNH